MQGCWKVPGLLCGGLKSFQEPCCAGVGIPRLSLFGLGWKHQRRLLLRDTSGSSIATLLEPQALVASQREWGRGTLAVEPFGGLAQPGKNR